MSTFNDYQQSIQCLHRTNSDNKIAQLVNV